jgi:hypothetical protein
MLRMRLSLDCGCAAVATQGGSDNLFAVESLTALTRVSRRVTLSSARGSQGKRGRAERAFTGSVLQRNALPSVRDVLSRQSAQPQSLLATQSQVGRFLGNVLWDTFL